MDDELKEILIVIAFGTVCFMLAVLACGLAINIAIRGL